MAKIIVFTIAILIAAGCTQASFRQRGYGDLVGTYLYNYDGDTITVNIKDVHPLIGEKIRIRVAGIDTPEIKGTSGKEQRRAQAAKRLTHKLCRRANKIELKNVRRGTYFRIVADVYLDGQSLAKALVKEKLADNYVYRGRKSN